MDESDWVLVCDDLLSSVLDYSPIVMLIFRIDKAMIVAVIMVMIRGMGM